MKSKIWIVSAIGLVVSFSAPVVAQDNENPNIEHLVSDERVEEDRAKYTPLLQRVPILCHGDGCGNRTVDTSGLVSLADYPLDAWNEKRTGPVEARIYVGEEGRILHCAIMVSSGHEDLDRATCRRVNEYTRNSLGVSEERPKVVEHTDFRFVWELKQPEFPGSVTVTTRMVMGLDGQEKSCELIEMSGPVPDRVLQDIKSEPCPWTLTRTKAPYRDEEGRPVEKAVTVTFRVTVEDLPE